MYLKRGRQRGITSFLRWISLALVFSGVILTVFSLVRYSRIRNSFPLGMMVAEVPIGGMTQEQAAQRITEAYGLPVELHYQDAVIQVRPSVVGFELDLTAMLTAADLQRINLPFWNGFWDYLWNHLPTPGEVPLRAKISEERLRTYLTTDIAPRYNSPPTEAVPVPGTVNFQPGQPGMVLDVDRAVILIQDALRSPTSRVVNLSFSEISPARPSLGNLQILLKQVIDLSGFEGLTEIYTVDLQDGKDLSFAYKNGEDITPGVSFTAASTIKIPIMISIYEKTGDPTPQDVTTLMELMIERSENDPADQMMKTYLDTTLGPLKVTDDMAELGLVNTFLGGYFYPQAPLLRRYDTPANLRTDISTDPDVYNQTTPIDMGMLLEDLYYCGQQGGGALPVVFPGRITQSECNTMIDFLANDKIGVLIQAGVPDGTRVAHKHGWITESDGLIHTIGDAGIVFSPGGNFVLCIYLNDQTQLVWDTANLLMAQLTSAVYNYYNQIQ
jgi:beta-lactamase class A